MNRVSWRRALVSLLLAVAVVVGFAFLFVADNKYQTPPPYGRSGVLSLTEADLQRKTPVFLIDGWLLTDASATALPTYIGQYASLQRGSRATPPHGAACYELTLRYTGDPIGATINFPQLFSKHEITFDGALLSTGTGGARVSIQLTQGDHLLRVRTYSTHGYYSGMYHPAALGSTRAVSQMVLVQCIAYGLAFFAPLVLAIFTLALWYSAKDRATFWFGLLCCCFSAYVSYYFVRLLNLAVGEYWYLVQSAAFYGLCLCVLRLTTLAGEVERLRGAQWLQRIAAGIAASLLLLTLLIPKAAIVVRLHAALTDLFYAYTFCGVLLLAHWGRHAAGRERHWTQLGCISFGAGLLYNLLSANLFEPIRFFWQFEWCGLLLVTLFGAMMVARNRRILAENTAFQYNLEEMVQQRTAELRNLLQERKAFFVDVAHDLKAPIFAAGSFIQAIRAHNTGVDSELQYYIDLVEQKQQEMLHRVQGLTAFNRMDELSEPYEALSIHRFLNGVYQTYRPAADVQAVHLLLELPPRDAALYAPPKKLMILFENLIFNALRATPADGKITLSATLGEGVCHLCVTDTGCGIAAAELPFIFNRFFVGKESGSTGSGLGLYIVKCIVSELKGSVDVSSPPGQGVTFRIDLPLM